MPVAVLLNGAAATGAVARRHSMLPVMGVGLLPLLVMLVLACL